MCLGAEETKYTQWYSRYIRRRFGGHRLGLSSVIRWQPILVSLYPLGSSFKEGDRMLLRVWFELRLMDVRSEWMTKSQTEMGRRVFG